MIPTKVGEDGCDLSLQVIPAFERFSIAAAKGPISSW